MSIRSFFLFLCRKNKKQMIFEVSENNIKIFDILSVGRCPADYSVGGWLYVFCLSIFLLSPSNLVSTVITHPLCNCLVKKINQGTAVFTHKHTELPVSSFRVICVLKHIHTRLIILTCGKNNHKIKITGIGQLAVGSRPVDFKYTFIISENADTLTTCMGRGEGVCEKEFTGKSLLLILYTLC